MAPYVHDWTNPAVGGHLLQAVAHDNEGDTGQSILVPINVQVSAAYTAATFFSDDFSDESLAAPWTITDGTTGTTITQLDGHVRLAMPAVSQDPFGATVQAVTVLQPESAGALALELKLAAADFAGDSFAGALAVGTGGALVQCIARRDAGIWSLAWGASDGVGPFTDLGSLPLLAVGDALWLQVRRLDDAWTCLYSLDGLTFETVVTMNRIMTLAEIGWTAGPLSAAAPPTAALDYAFNLASPIVPEDGENGGDVTGPVIGEITATPDFTAISLTWQTDEAAISRVDYGFTDQFELGSETGSSFSLDHLVDLTGLSSGMIYHLRVTCIDLVGNITVAPALQLGTHLMATAAPGPGPGDIYRESSRVMVGEDWRVTDPEALNPGAQAYLPNPLLSLTVPDLAGAVRAEFVIDRWNGHPGTSEKRMRFNNGSWLYLPELQTTPPGAAPECYQSQDNVMIDVPLAQLVTGGNALEGRCDEQVCYGFDWAQWGWYAVLLRVYYDPATVAEPTCSILSPAAGDTIPETTVIDLDASAAGSVDEVRVLAYYEGNDTDGDGIFTEWHRYYHRRREAITLEVGGIVGSDDTAPYQVTWDATWVPDQEPGAVKLQARVRDDTGLWYVSPVIENLTLHRPDETVRFYTMDVMPPNFWVRTGESKSAEFTIPGDHDLALALEARIYAHTWNGAGEGLIELNGLWSNTNLGASHHFASRNFQVPVSAFLSGLNEIVVSSTALGHGVELLWPGPMVSIRYSLATGNPVIAPAGGVYQNGVTVALSSDDPGAAIYYTTDGTEPSTGSSLYTDPLALDATTMVKAIAHREDTGDSPVVSAHFNITDGQSPRAENALQALYVFDEGGGDVAHDVAGVLPALDLTVQEPASVSWLPEGGLSVDHATLIQTSMAATRLTEAICVADAFTIEAWVQPATAAQAGPARVVSVAGNPTTRNICLAHGGGPGSPSASLAARVRTSATDPDGLPELTTPPGSVSGELQHVVLRCDAQGDLTVFIDGVESAAAHRDGDLGCWNAGFPLSLAAEADGSSPWQGRYQLVAIYSRALSLAEIQQNLAAGASAAPLRETSSPPVPRHFALHQNFPNPFNPSTAIVLDLPQGADVTLKVYDLRGRVVRRLFSGALPIGTHNFVWDGRDDSGQAAAGGVYVYRIESQVFSNSKRMTLIK